MAIKAVGGGAQSNPTHGEIALSQNSQMEMLLRKALVFSQTLTQKIESMSTYRFECLSEVAKVIKRLEPQAEDLSSSVVDEVVDEVMGTMRKIKDKYFQSHHKYHFHGPFGHALANLDEADPQKSEALRKDLAGNFDSRCFADETLDSVFFNLAGENFTVYKRLLEQIHFPLQRARHRDVQPLTKEQKSDLDGVFKTYKQMGFLQKPLFLAQLAHQFSEDNPERIEEIKELTSVILRKLPSLNPYDTNDQVGEIGYHTACALVAVDSKKALQIADQYTDTWDKGMAYRDIALMLLKSKPEAALNVLLVILDTSKKFTLSQEDRSKIITAFVHYDLDKTLKAIKSLKSLSDQGHALIQIASVLKTTDLSKAQSLIQQAIAYSEELFNKGRNHEYYAEELLIFALVVYAGIDPQKAWECSKAAENKCDPREFRVVYQPIARNLLKIDLEKAKQVYEKSIETLHDHVSVVLQDMAIEVAPFDLSYAVSIIDRIAKGEVQASIASRAICLGLIKDNMDKAIEFAEMIEYAPTRVDTLLLLAQVAKVREQN